MSIFGASEMYNDEPSKLGKEGSYVGKKAWVLGILLVAGIFFILITMAPHAVAGTINYGFTGVPFAAQGTYVKNILQLTDNEYADTAQCWGAYPWGPNGQWIVYSSEIEGSGSSDREVCKIKPDGTGYVRLTDNSMCDSHPSFTPNGTKIVFQRRVSGDAEIWIMNADGTGQASLTQVHGGAVTGYCENKPVISPDGTKIAFHTCDKDIWVMNIDGSNPVKVSGTLAECTKQSWSPDSRWVLFNSDVSGSYPSTSQASRIFKVRADGSSLTMLSENVDEEFCDNWASWSPDGNWIAYHNRDQTFPQDRYSLRIMRSDGTGKTTLVQEIDDNIDFDGVCGPTSWSPDSEWIAFKKRHASDNRSIFIINIETLETIQLTENYYDLRHWWSPDGSRILFKDRDWGNLRDVGQYDEDLLVINLYPAKIFGYDQFLVETGGIKSFTGTSAIGSGLVQNSSEVMAHGLCWSTSPTPFLAAHPHTDEGGAIGEFTSEMTGLTPNTRYQVRAYAQVNQNGSIQTVYGGVVPFMTGPNACDCTLAGDVNGDQQIDLEDAIIDL